MNVPRLVVQFGQPAAWTALAASAAAVVIAARRGRGGLPRGAGGWLTCLLAAAVAWPSATFLAWAAHKIEPLKPVFGQADRPAADFAFTGLDDGAVHHLADYRGKVVVLNLWATWCGPCAAEIPGLDRLQRAYGDSGLVVIAVTDEPRETVEKYPRLAAWHAVKGRFDARGPGSSLFVSADVARPLSHVIDRDGVLRETLLGAQPYAAFVARVRPLLAASAR